MLLVRLSKPKTCTVSSTKVLCALPIFRWVCWGLQVDPFALLQAFGRRRDTLHNPTTLRNEQCGLSSQVVSVIQNSSVFILCFQPKRPAASNSPSLLPCYPLPLFRPLSSHTLQANTFLLAKFARTKSRAMPPERGCRWRRLRNGSPLHFPMIVEKFTQFGLWLIRINKNFVDFCVLIFSRSKFFRWRSVGPPIPREPTEIPLRKISDFATRKRNSQIACDA